MDVILLEKVRNLGSLGDKVSVKSGYGRNFLIPQNKAVPATASNVASFEARRAELEKEASALLVAAQLRAEKLEGLAAVTIVGNAGDEGKLFGSIGTADIAAAVTAAGVELSKAEVRMPEGAIRAIGEYSVTVHLHVDVDSQVSVSITAE